MRSPFTRRGFLESVSSLAAVPALLGGRSAAGAGENSQLALLGGPPVRRERFPSWPVIAENDERGLMDVLRGKRWNRSNGQVVSQFEKVWAEKLGAKYALATANGTSALFASFNALGIGPGDEVLVPPYTFVATVNAVLLQHALPVFVDVDPETSQIDPRKIEAAITERTRCIVPVHIGGSAADLDAILAIGQKHKLPVVEDACQSHLAEWRQRRVGTLGTLGCFSLQASKNLNSGEGGIVVTNDEELYRECRSFHNQGGSDDRHSGFHFVRNGCNLRMTEFQGALLLSQLTRLDDQAKTREQNAQYLTGLLREIPGILPARMYEGCTRNAYHLYMFRYNQPHFAEQPRARFLQALRAEGIPASSGYTPLEKEPFIRHTLQSRAYKTIYPAERLAKYEDQLHCPQNEKLCSEAVWLTQNMLLGPRSDMDQIAEAVRKIQKQAGLLARA